MIRALVLFALLARGSIGPSVTIESSAGKSRSLPEGKPILVIYEDQDGGKDNVAVKEMLGRINASPENRAHCESIAVADVEKWNWWPAKKYALDDIRKAEKAKSTVVWLDWKGSVRKAWGLARGKNNLVLIAPDGKILWSSSGTLQPADRDALLDVLRSLGVTTP
jgi:predicted transcriptional regulator